MLDNFYRIVVSRHHELIPQLLEPGNEQTFIDRDKTMHRTIESEIDKKSITDRELETSSTELLEGPPEGIIISPQILYLLLGPLVLQILAIVFSQLLISALLRKGYIVDRTYTVEIQKLKVYLIIDIISALRDQPRHIGKHCIYADIRRYRDPLIPFHHIEGSHIFVCLDRLTDSLLYGRIIQLCPLRRKL